MALREAKAWRVYRYRESDSVSDGKLILALWVESAALQGVMIHAKPARIRPLRKIERLLTLDFLPRPRAFIRFDTLIRASWEAFTATEQEKKWVVTGRARYQVLEQALGAESRLPRAAKRRLLQENRAFLNHWAKRLRA